MSYKAEVIADSSGKWVGNGIVLATKEEAEAYAKDLMMRWTLVTDRRVVESDEPVNYRWVPGEGLHDVVMPPASPDDVNARLRELAADLRPPPLVIVGGKMEDWGIIPTFLDTADPRSAKQQIDGHYQGGWNAFPGFSFDKPSLALSYPGDPPMKPVSSLLFRNEMLLIYPHEWVLILQKDGSWEAARLD